MNKIFPFFRLNVTTMLLFLGIVTCNAQMLSGQVVKVTDGDTFTLLIDGKTQKRIRLYGIDAPETKGNQPFCQKSRQFLAQMIAGQTVGVRVMDTDKYGRSIGIVRTTQLEDVNLEMIKAGMAWHYSYYDRTPTYKQAEKEARKSRKGLWADKHPINPYKWRKGVR